MVVMLVVMLVVEIMLIINFGVAENEAGGERITQELCARTGREYLGWELTIPG